MSSERASIFDTDDLDVSGFAPKPGPDRKAPTQAQVRAVAETGNFRSREPSPAAPAPARIQRRYRTGRTVQFNMKASQETVDAFNTISDQEGWSLAETLEHALAALREARARTGKVGSS